MVDESGLRTARAGKSRSQLLSAAIRILILSAALVTAAGCVYFNQLYNANRLFVDGRKDIEEGRVGAGQASLSAAIEKAEKIARDNPNSRWADDALRLIVRARILRDEWLEAAQAAEQLAGYARTRKDSVEVAGYLGIASVYLGEVTRADSLLSFALAEDAQPDIRADLYLNRGRARMVLRREVEADADLVLASELRPDWVDPRLDRVRLLVAMSRNEEAAAEMVLLLLLPLNEAEQGEVISLAEYLSVASPETGVAALAEVESSSLRRADRVRMVKLRGDMNFELDRVEAAMADYDLVAEMSPESLSAVDAQAALVDRRLREATVPEQLDGYLATMMRISRVPAARSSREVARIRDTLIRMDYWIDAGGLGYMLAAEAARDELRAPRLARRLFLGYVDSDASALWAPKAILAALDLTDLDSDEPSAEELRQRLLEDFGDSAYVQMFTGQTGAQFTYEDLEQGLRRQLDRLERLADQEVRDRLTTTPN
jgi:hypothetical protein